MRKIFFDTEVSVHAEIGGRIRPETDRQTKQSETVSAEKNITHECAALTLMSKFDVGDALEFCEGGTCATIAEVETGNKAHVTYIVVTSTPVELAGLKVRVAESDLKTDLQKPTKSNLKMKKQNKDTAKQSRSAKTTNKPTDTEPGSSRTQEQEQKTNGGFEIRAKLEGPLLPPKHPKVRQPLSRLSPGEMKPS